MPCATAMTRWLATTALLACLAGGFTTAALAGDHSPAGLELTALDRYVRMPDPNYEYGLEHYVDGDGYRAFVLNMVSQAYLTPEIIDRPLWEHWLTIVRPDEVTTDTGLLIIGGGSNDDKAPSGPNGRLVAIAKATNSVVAELGMVPNQPLTFLVEAPKKRGEDSLIAYTWDKFLQTGDEKWPLRLPMTKSAVRAMDTITSFMGSDEGGNVTVTKFVVSGGSKRGWTTWTTAAVDNRVVAIMPIVIDLLNLEPSFIHHYRVYGRYARAVKDYEDMNVMSWTGTREYRRLLEMVEPFEYRKRLTLPKYLLNSTGDQFFIPDSSQFYFSALEGEKYLRYIPNADHGMGGTDIIESMISWYHAIVHNVPRPRFTWEIEADGTIRVLALDKPTEVRLWRASNKEARNFQKQVIGNAYSSAVLPEQEEGVYVARVPVPEEGWTAYFVELTFPSGTATPFKFTTDVKVIPDVYPFKWERPKKKDHAVGFTEK